MAQAAARSCGLPKVFDFRCGMTAAALANGATVLYSEAMQHGLVIGDSMAIPNLPPVDTE